MCTCQTLIAPHRRALEAAAVLPPPPQGRLMLERAPAARALQGGANVLFNISLRLSMQPTDPNVIAYGGPGAALAAVMAALVATTAPGNQLLFPNTNAAWSTANLVQNVFGISPMVVAQSVPVVVGTFSPSPTPSQTAAASSQQSLTNSQQLGLAIGLGVGLGGLALIIIVWASVMACKVRRAVAGGGGAGAAASSGRRGVPPLPPRLPPSSLAQKSAAAPPSAAAAASPAPPAEPASAKAGPIPAAPAST